MQHVTDKNPNILDFTEDFKTFLDYASRSNTLIKIISFYINLNYIKYFLVDLACLQSKIKEMKTNNNNIQIDLRLVKSKNDTSNEKFVEIMDPFLEEAQSKYETIECMLTKMNEAFRNLAEFYSFDPDKYTMSEFFTDLKVFSHQFHQCHMENVKLKETEEKIRRAEEERGTNF